jgi:hypothetical protein
MSSRLHLAVVVWLPDCFTERELPMAFGDFVRRLLRPNGRTPRPQPAQASSPDTRWLQALTDFGYPYRIVAGEQAVAAFDAEAEIGARDGFSPVIIAPGYWNSSHISPDTRAARAVKMLREPCDAAAGRDFLEQLLVQLYDDLEFDPACIDPAVFDNLQPVAPPPVDSGLAALQRHNQETRSMELVPRVAIMRIPTTDSTTIPAYLDWGGWNSVPSSIEIVAIARHWNETYGARLIAVGSDVLEFKVARKPASHAEACALLQEQYCFAPDNWENDRDCLEEAAARLQVADSWFFWWD